MKMDELKNYIEKNSIVDGVLEELKKAKLPLVIFGAGDRANYLYRYLKKSSIGVDAIVVNAPYWKSEILLDDMLVEKYETILEKYPKINIILGISGALLKGRDLFNSPNVNKVYALSVGVMDDYLLEYAFFIEHYAILQDFYKSLADNLSQKLLVAHINGRITGKDIDFDLAPYRDPEYFFAEFMKDQMEFIVDGGAFIGDTVEEYKAKISAEKFRGSRMYCFEPDQDNYRKLIERYGKSDNVSCYNLGLWHDEDELCFNNVGGEAGAILQDGNCKIKVNSMDNVLKDNKVTFIKMDIEGSELEALKGAQKIIRQQKPTLAICVYHKKADLLTIPQYIHSLVPEYKFYLRTHSAMPTELVLFAIM
jgi:methyltransferase, FkbM family